MDMSEIKLPEVKVLVAFGRIGVDLVASRMLSMTTLFGVVAVSSYSVYAASWQGAACVVVMAFCFMVAVRAESRQAPKEE